MKTYANARHNNRITERFILETKYLQLDNYSYPLSSKPETDPGSRVVGASTLVGVCRLPTWSPLCKNVCQNKRIGSSWGVEIFGCRSPTANTGKL